MKETVWGNSITFLYIVLQSGLMKIVYITLLIQRFFFKSGWDAVFFKEGILQGLHFYSKQGQNVLFWEGFLLLNFDFF